MNNKMIVPEEMRVYNKTVISSALEGYYMERKDNKGRILWSGEYQKADGRYEYRFADVLGKKHSVYSWKLTKTDKIPKGMQQMECLRDMEKKIEKDILDGIIPCSLTLNDKFAEYLEKRTDLKRTTKLLYENYYNWYVRDTIGNMLISEIKYTTISDLYSDMLERKKLSFATVKIIDNVLSHIFYRAFRDGLIRANPVTKVLLEEKQRRHIVQQKKTAMSYEDQSKFLEYLKKTGRGVQYLYLLFLFMFCTGTRVGEACGMRWEDIDFTNNLIHIKQIITWDRYGSERTIHVSSPKSSNGIRDIPLLSILRDALKEEYKRQLKEGFCKDTIDGVSGFVFMNNSGHVPTYPSICRSLRRACEAVNIERFSCHTTRHYFCVELCRNETDARLIMEIMGHSDFRTTQNIYNECSIERKQKSFANLDGKIRVG